MKNLKKIMLIALAALMMAAMPQAVMAQAKRPQIKIERHDDKHKPMKPVMARAMSGSDFSMMFKIVKNASFDKDRIDIIRVACIGSNLSSNQCAKLLSLLSFDNNKLEALEVMAPRIVDNDYNDKILKQFSFSANREKAARILRKHT